MTQIKVNDVVAEGTTQARAYDEKLAAHYAEAMKDGAQFPPIVVYRDGNGAYVADGFHRVGAARIVGMDRIEADVRKPEKGENAQRSAILYAVSANDEHGRNRSNSEKKHAVEMLLRDPEWSKWTDREIARQCRVSHTMVRKRRDSLINGGAIKDQGERKSRRGDKVTKVKTPKSQKTKSAKNKEKTPSSGNVSTPEWTAEDESAYLALQDAWKAARPHVQSLFLREFA